MTHSLLIKNARLVNDGQIVEADLRIINDKIGRIESELNAIHNEEVVDAEGCCLLPGMIDDQVHFREPGLTHKGTIASESRAAVAGGITSYMEMPNVNPATTSIEMLEKKYVIASESSIANYAFYLGATEDNLEQVKRLDPKKHCGMKVFTGASTGDLLVEKPEALDGIFRESPALIAAHCENGPLIAKNYELIKRTGKEPTILEHPTIRNAEACYASSSYAVSLAKQYQSQLHVLHITTERELSLFDNGPIENKRITAEACVHHLWFCDEDYPLLGNLIKCNPAIKTANDRDALIKALHTNQIDIIATDHAPHTLGEKQQAFNLAPAGLPLIQYALLTLFDHVSERRLSLEQVVEKTAHNPAKRYGVEGRGFIREGSFADLVLVNTNTPFIATHENSLYHCGWTPFVNHQFTSRIKSTWVNGQQVFDGQKVIDQPCPSKRLTFNR